MSLNTRGRSMSTADQLRELIAKASSLPWGITEQGDLRRGEYESSMDANDALLIAVLVNCVEQIAAVLAPIRWDPLTGRKGLFCRECRRGIHDHADYCLVGALDRALAKALEETK